MKNNFKNYTIIQEKYEKDINSNCIYLQHNKTKAKIFLMQNDEENKVFSIFFRTPVNDSKGTPHILEHSVLCGSRKYDVKDPFIELAKGSMKTFLNAMTFFDKTGYPVASCNTQDFKNLMDVYLDAVFFPNIYKNEYILKQEGWHYEIDDVKSPITINGVVYNEMKGLFSNPNAVLEYTIMKNLFKGTTYAYESGGDPAYIPTLTYKEFLDFHKKFYHPSNSYIILYGNMDFEERLKYIDEEYLSKFDYLKVNSKINNAKLKPVKETVEYYNLDIDNVNNKDYMSISFRLDNKKIALNNIIYKIFAYYLFDREGAVLKEELLKEGIAEDIDSLYSNEMKENAFSIIAKNTNYKNKNKFIKIIYKSLNKIYNEGFDQNIIEAALNKYEFEIREAQSDDLPRGLEYSIDLMESFLYDESPFIYLEYEKAFNILRKENNNKKNNIFTKMLKEKFIDNDNISIVSLIPKKGLLQEKEKKLEKILEIGKNKLTNDELNSLIKFTKDFKNYQKQVDPIEKYESIPVLKKSEIEKYKKIYTYQEKNVNEQKCVFVPSNVNGITYFDESYELANYSDEVLIVLSIYSYLFGRIDTKNYNFSKLDECIDSISGGFNSKLYCINDKVYFSSGFKCLSNNIKKCIDLLNEIKYNQIFNDKNRIKKLIVELKIDIENNLQSYGHTCANTRALSCINKELHNTEITSLNGISFYNYIKELVFNFDEKIDKLLNNLHYINENVFNENKKITFVSSIDFDTIKHYINKNNHEVHNTKCFNSLFDIKPFLKNNCNEAFQTSSEVNFVSMCSNMDYVGELQFVKTLLSYDYLWQNVRVLGGAYGCMSNFSNKNFAYLVSYRDPHIKETIYTYNGISNYLKNIKLTDREINKYIIGTISSIDNPKGSFLDFEINIQAFLNNKDNDSINKTRNEILNITNEKINEVSKNFNKFYQNANICVIGSKSEIEKNNEMFKEIIKLDV